ncbi:MAG: DUF2167 domain-containing protein [Acidobacteria bacterium]|nr:DUF2167 domain-containing protein [Acidobacteriota bacterium]
MKHLAVVLVFLTFPAAYAQEAPEPAAAEPSVTLEEFVAGLHFQTGSIDVADGVATLEVPETFQYLGAEEAQSVLEDLWGNPPDDTVLGMLFPADTPLDSMESWGVVITYEQDGYVDDKDAAEIDYDDLLAEMQSDVVAANEFRRKEGYPEVELVGWAAPPYYDSSAKKLYWAKDLKFASSEADTLNYNIRVLGRRGVLVLNAIASMEQLAPVRTRMEDVMAFVNFNEGHRYSEFDPDIDEVAAYGIGALIAGKVAAKAGLLKVFGVFLAKFWKLIAIAGVAVFGFLKKLLTGRLGEQETGA